MSKIQYLREQLMAHRKAKASDSVVTLSTLIGEVERNAKSPAFAKMTEDQIVVHVIQKTAEGLNERQRLAWKSENVSDILQEIETEQRIIEALIKELVPVQLDENQLSSIINELVIQRKAQGLTGGALIGAVNKQLKADYDGQYDGKTANQYIRDSIAQLA